MNRINLLFQNNPGNLLSIYFCAGCPTLEGTADVIRTLEKNGVNMIEIGIPFSDPMADGIVIQDAATCALRNGMSLRLLFEQLQDVFVFRPDLGDRRHAFNQLHNLKIVQNIGVSRQTDPLFFKIGLGARHILAVPLRRQHNLFNRGGAVFLAGDFRQIGTVAAGVIGGEAEKRQVRGDIVGNLPLLFVRHVADFQDKRRFEI